MGRITAGTGLISGIDSRSLIDQLMSLEARPRQLLQNRIEQANVRKTALTDLQTRLTSLRIAGATLKRPSSFRDASATTSDDKVITATANPGAAAGAYDIRVSRLVTSQQTVSSGFSDANASRVGAGSLTLEVGGGDLNQTNLLDDLNGGRGVQRGTFRVTDRTGASSIVDISDAVSVDDVVKRINSSLQTNVRAAVDGNRIKITDQTGAVTSELKIENIGNSTTASDLGIAASSVSGTINGTNVRSLGNASALSALNDGLGVRRSSTAIDMTITAGDGTAVNVELGSGGSLGDVIRAINTAGATKFTAAVAADGQRLVLTDTSGGGGQISVANATGSSAATDLGLTGAASGNTLTGDRLVADLGTTLIRNLNGGRGITLGLIAITNRNGIDTQIDTTGVEDVQDLLDRVNNANAGVTARLKSGSANGIEIVDNTGGTANLQINDVAGSTANELGLAGVYGTDVAAARGANLQRKWMNENTLLKDLNGGRGVAAGSVRIANSRGELTTLNLSAATNVGDIIRTINARTATGVTARINDNGDGILLTDAAGGTGAMRIDEAGSTTARGLNLLGTASANVINGSFEKTVAIDATDTLTDVQNKINDASWGLSASVINDGTGSNSFRLNLTSIGSGRAGRVVFDEGSVSLGARTLVESQDAVVMIGDTNSNAGRPLVVTASTNSINGAIRGVNLQLNGISSQSVRLNVAQDVSNVVEQVKKYVTSFNELNETIKQYTKFDSATNERGPLLGDSAVAGIQDQLFAVFNSSYGQNASLRTTSDIGLRVGAESKVEFDESKFKEAFARDPGAVTSLFTASDRAIDTDTALSTLNSGRGVRTNPAGTNDLRFQLRNGTSFELDLDDVRSVADVQRLVSTASNGRVSIEVRPTTGSLRLVDSTTGTTAFRVTNVNGSVAADDLGISGNSINGAITGSRIASERLSSLKGGIGTQIESRINRLIDPINGTITQASKTIDSRNADSDRRITAINRQLASKRTRLERQFATMEDTLARLQSQQSSLGNINQFQQSR